MVCIIYGGGTVVGEKEPVRLEPVNQNPTTECHLPALFTYMIGWFSSPQIIIIHGGQIVMNEGHGMDHFNRHGRRHGDRGGFFGITSKHFGGGETQNRSNAFPSGHETVAHAVTNLLRFGFFTDNRLVEGVFDSRKLLGKVGFEIERVIITLVVFLIGLFGCFDNLFGILRGSCPSCRSHCG